MGQTQLVSSATASCLSLEFPGLDFEYEKKNCIHKGSLFACAWVSRYRWYRNCWGEKQFAKELEGGNDIHLSYPSDTACFI